jgi:serine/threonine-protein kinase
MQSRFQILEHVSRSACSTVVRALDSQTGSQVALKRPITIDAHWEREARAFALIPPHSHLIHRLDEDSDEHGPYRSLEWIAGRTLDGLQSDETTTRHIVRGILTGLVGMHDAGFVHVDVSPANVLLNAHGEAIVIDLGNACPVSEATPHLVGTIQCMAPERFDNAPPSIAGDLYGIGVIAYRLMAGHYPFDGDTTPQIITAHHRHQCSSLRDQVTVSQAFDHWIMTMLARNPSERPASASEAFGSLLHP